MASETDDLALEHLHALRSDVSDSRKRDREILSRLASMEGLLAVMHADMLQLSTHIDDHEERLELLEKRAGFMNADA